MTTPAEGSAPRSEPWHDSLIAEGDQVPIGATSERDWDVPGYIPAKFEDGSLIVFSKSRVPVEDRLLPRRVAFKLPLAVSHIPGEPWVWGGISVLDGVPQLVKLEFKSDEGGREIRQSDLRAIEINSLVVDLMAALSIHVDQSNSITTFRMALPGEDGPGDRFTSARRFVERRRRPPGLREITPELLKRVAEVYRSNFDHAPTEAVAKAFGVKQRMASTYVQRARTAGYLSPTKQGRKQA